MWPVFASGSSSKSHGISPTSSIIGTVVLLSVHSSLPTPQLSGRNPGGPEPPLERETRSEPCHPGVPVWGQAVASEWEGLKQSTPKVHRHSPGIPFLCMWPAGLGVARSPDFPVLCRILFDSSPFCVNSCPPSPHAACGWSVTAAPRGCSGGFQQAPGWASSSRAVSSFLQAAGPRGRWSELGFPCSLWKCLSLSLPAVSAGMLPLLQQNVKTHVQEPPQEVKSSQLPISTGSEQSKD